MIVPFRENTLLNGTWIIDRHLSSWSNGLFPRDSMNLSVSMKLENGRLFYHSMNQSNSGTPPSHFQFDIPLDDCPHPFMGSQRFTHLQGRLLPDGALEILKLREMTVVIAEIWRRDQEGPLFRWGVSCAASNGPKVYTEYFHMNCPGIGEDRFG